MAQRCSGNALLTAGLIVTVIGLRPLRSGTGS